MEHEGKRPGQPLGALVPDWRPREIPSREAMQGRFCRLEALRPEVHAKDLFAANATDAEGRMWTYLPYGPFDAFEVYLAWTQAQCGINEPIYYAVVDRAAGAALGLASYLRIDPGNGSLEVGHIAYSPRLQRTPAATEAMYLMMERAFSLGYRRYEWKCNALNAPSREAALRLGFSFEGVFRQAAVVKGRNRDTAWYSVIDTEWPALRSAFLRWLDPSNFDERGVQRLSLSGLTAPLIKSRG